MPRRARLRLADVPFHVIQRGHNKSPCFFRESDYRYYLDQLAAVTHEHGVAVHAYVLMTNHVHLLVTPRTATGLSVVMKHLGQRYVQFVNSVHQRTGTLWEGRFRSSIVDTDRYLMTCQRYIELNPVRAGLVRHPAQYDWCSYRRNAYGAPDPIVTPHPLYQALGQQEQLRLAAYRALFQQDIDPQLLARIRHATSGGYLLGDETFAQCIEAAAQRPVPRPKNRPRRPRAA